MVAVAWAGAGGLVLVLGCMAVAIVALLGFARPIVDAYTDDAAVLALGTVLLGYAVLFQFSDGIQALANGALRGLKDTLVPAAVTIFAYWGVGFPVGWWLGLQRGLGAPGLWIGFIAGLTVVDPMVAVLIGMLVLGEAAAAPWWVFIIFGVAGGIAVWGVVGLARFHPQVLSESQELPIQRGSGGTAPDSAHPSTASIKVTEAVAKVWPEPPVKDPADEPDAR